MNSRFFERFLEEKSFGFAYLSSQKQISEYNQKFVEFAVNPVVPNQQTIFDLYPETIGLESIFDALHSGEKTYFSLKSLTREFEKNEIKYFDFSILNTEQDEYPFLCLVEDVSCSSQQKQKITQQKYEIIFLKKLLHYDDENKTDSILGNSPPVQKVRTLINKLSQIPTTTILLQGESGTGKNLVAKVIHSLSQEENAPFIEINCAAIPETLLESELFGYEKGAFTNAVTSKMGLLEAAHGGTLFLDEIGELPIKLQVKLLSFLETKKFRRLGSTKEIHVNIRLITATNRNLEEMVKENAFRRDLFYRLNVVNLELPPLRILGDDILIIANHFIRVFNSEFDKKVKGFTTEAKNKLETYHWPGNVRELKNSIERTMIFIENDYIEPDHLILGNTLEDTYSTNFFVRFSLSSSGFSLKEFEKRLLKDALSLTNGNQTKAAKILHLSRDAFRYRLEKYKMLS